MAKAPMMKGKQLSSSTPAFLKTGGKKMVGKQSSKPAKAK